MSEQNTVVVDLGKFKKKSVKRLRKGEGKLMDRVGMAVEEIRSSLPEGTTMPTVVVVVREKPKLLRGLLG